MSEVRFHVGDRVKFRLGLRFVEGVVREDRGTIGVNGCRLYPIKFSYEHQGDAPSVIELPVEEIQLVDADPSTNRANSGRRTKAETRFRKGDHVKFQFGIYPIQGVVKEDRGPIGVKGRRLYLLEFLFGADADSPTQIELPAERLELVRENASTE